MNKDNPDLVPEIIKSPEAKKFLKMVTKDFYNSSYVGLWIYEAIGREWDEMREWAEGLRTEIFPQTCTWSIAIWEWVYGIEPDDSLSLEYRRQRLFSRVRAVSPINPEVLRQSVIALIGGDDSTVDVTDFTAPYTFDVALHPAPGMPIWYDRIAEHIWNIKPSHLAFNLYLETKIDIEVWVTASWVIFPYGITDRYHAGTRPHTSTPGVVYRGDVVVEPEETTGDVPHILAGTRPRIDMPGIISRDTVEIEPVEETYEAAHVLAGTRPDISTIGSYNPRTVEIHPEEQEQEFKHNPAGKDKKTGTYPEISTQADVSRIGVDIEPEGRSQVHPYPLASEYMKAGTFPDTSVSGHVWNSKVEVHPDGKYQEHGYTTPREDRKTGTYPDVSTQAKITPANVRVDPDGEHTDFAYTPTGTRPEISTPGSFTEVKARIPVNPGSREFEYTNPGENRKPGQYPYPMNVGATGGTAVETETEEQAEEFPYTEAGTRPDASETGVIFREGAEIPVNTETREAIYTEAGTKPGISEAGSSEAPGMGTRISSETAGIVHKICGSKRRKL